MRCESDVRFIPDSVFRNAGRTRAEVESVVINGCVACWRELQQRDLDRGGDGVLRGIAIALTRGRTLVTLHSDYHDDERRMSVSFRLSRPLPPDEDVVPLEVVGEWQRCEGGFLLRLHEWLESQQPCRSILPARCIRSAMSAFGGKADMPFCTANVCF